MVSLSGNNGSLQEMLEAECEDIIFTNIICT